MDRLTLTAEKRQMQMKRLCLPALHKFFLDISILSITDGIMTFAKDATHPVAALRQARGWSQAALAERAGLPRSSVAAIECRQLVPSVTAALAVARALERDVEELFGGTATRGQPGAADWAWTPAAEPTRFWHAEVGGRHLRFPVEPVFRNPLPHDGVAFGDGSPETIDDLASKTLVLACCDPAAGLLATEYARTSGFRLLVFQRGGRAALEMLKAGVIHLAGIHRSTGEHPERNAESAREVLGGGCRLLRAARWQAGIAVAAENRRRTVRGLLKQAGPWALREEGSAAGECLDELCERKRPAGRVVDGHVAVAQAVRSGWAGAGVCVELAAREAGLDFLSLRAEDLDFCYPASLDRDPRLRALIRLLRSASYRRLIGELPGYDASETGELLLP